MITNRFALFIERKIQKLTTLNKTKFCVGKVNPEAHLKVNIRKFAANSIMNF